MLFWIGLAVYGVGAFLDFTFSMKNKQQRIPELYPFLRGSDGLFAPGRFIIGTVAVGILALVLYLNGYHEGMGYLMGALGVVHLIGAGFDYSKAK